MIIVGDYCDCRNLILGEEEYKSYFSIIDFKLIAKIALIGCEMSFEYIKIL